MADGFDSEDEKDTGSSLRKKYETALEENRALSAVAVAAKAQLLIQEKGYKHLSVKDLEGVGLSELETRAAELETQKASADAEALRRVLEANGLKDSELEQAVAGLLGKQDAAAALDQIRKAGRIQGTPPSKIADEGLFGPDRLRAAYAGS